jgi:hypothetical protein
MKPMGNSGNKAQKNLLCLILVGAVILRIRAACSGHVIHADEHFQVLEPAFRAVYGLGWRSWEWLGGFRPWTVPGVFIPLLGLMKALGVAPGMALVTACRVLMACLSALPLWGFHRLCEMRGLSPLVSLTTVGAMALLPNMGAWGASTFSESVVFILLWFTLPWQLDPKVGPLKKGVLAALPLAFRYQMGAWLLAFAPLAVARKPQSLLRFAVGAALPLLAVGLLDWATWGAPFHSLIYQMRLNAIQGASAMNGVSPWYAYGGMVLVNFGPWALGLLLLPVIGAATLGRLQWKAMDAQILLPALFFSMVHMAIGHKETRFLLPAFPALFYLGALGLEGLRAPWMTAPAFWRAVPTVALATAFSAGLVVSKQYYQEGSLGQLTAAGQHWLDRHPSVPPRVALVRR